MTRKLISLSTIPLEGIPTRVRLFKKGPNTTSKGIFNYDPSNIPLIEAKQKNEDGRDLYPIDVAHLSLTDAANPDAHISVGWFELSFEEDGIYADNIKWTPRGQAYLENREFRFISPAFDIRSTDEGKEITYISNFAITNNPATYNPLPLVASKETINVEELQIVTQDEAMDQRMDQGPSPGSNLKNKPKTAPSETVSPLAAHSEASQLNKEYNKEDFNKMSDLNETNQEKPVELSASEKPEEEVKEEEEVLPEEKDQMLSDLQAQNEELKAKLTELMAKLAEYESAVVEAEKTSVLDSLELSKEEKEFFSKLELNQLKEYSTIHLSKLAAAKDKVKEVQKVQEIESENDFVKNKSSKTSVVLSNGAERVLHLPTKEEIAANAKKIAAFRTARVLKNK
jgi:hypothetical protein